MFTVEIHMGGCGAIELSTDWSTKASNPVLSEGVSLGLKFCKDIFYTFIWPLKC